MNRVEFFIKLGQYHDMQTSKEENNSLEHQGIKGQKWGVRRWQNADGTFNEAGKERYFGKGNSKLGSTKDQKVGSGPNTKSGLEQRLAFLKRNEDSMAWNKDLQAKNRMEQWDIEKRLKNGDYDKMGSNWYMDSVRYNTPEAATSHAIAQQRVSQRIANETIDTYDTANKSKLARIMDRDYFSRIDRMQSALAKGKTEKYNKLLNKFKPEDQELVADYVNKLNKNMQENEDAYMYDFKNNRAKFDADSAKGVEQKVGGFGNIKNRQEAERAMDLLEDEYDKACSNIIKHPDEYDKYDKQAKAIMKQIEELDDMKFGSQAEAKKNIGDAIKGLFSKKDNTEDIIKKLKEEGQDELAEKYRQESKDLSQYKKVGARPGASDEEVKETRRACSRCMVTAFSNKWPLFFLFGPIGGAIIGSIASNAKINKMIDQLGLDRQNKDVFTASDWDKINEAIKESRRFKKKKNTETSAE